MLVSDSGLGKELADLLIAKLGIPEHVKSFSVNFGVGDAVTVDCSFFPTEPETEEPGAI